MLAHPKVQWRIRIGLDVNNGYRPKMSPHDHSGSIAESQQHVINTTNPRCALHNSIKHRLHVGGRTADDTEDLGCCGLMLQGLTQFRVALLEFLE